MRHARIAQEDCQSQPGAVVHKMNAATQKEKFDDRIFTVLGCRVTVVCDVGGHDEPGGAEPGRIPLEVSDGVIGDHAVAESFPEMIQ